MMVVRRSSRGVVESVRGHVVFKCGFELQTPPQQAAKDDEVHRSDLASHMQI